MLITGLSNNSYLENRILPAGAIGQSQVSPSRNTQDSVTLSPEAKAALEKFAAYPAWAGKYMPRVNVLNNADSRKTGYTAWEAGFRDTYKNELNEYDSKFRDYYEETKAEQGIATPEDYYSKVIAANSGNPAFRQAFESKLAGDPGMVELMNTLGIQQPGG